MTESQSKLFAQITQAAKTISLSTHSDVIILGGGLWENLDYQLCKLIDDNRKGPNVILFLATLGGSPDVAYKISRHLQSYYTKFTVVVDAYCKSAGTLIVVGANELVMSYRAELGPLDIQVGKSDEPKERTSGLAPVQALRLLQEQAATAYVNIFEYLNVELPLQTRTVGRTADRIVSVLFSRIYQQLEPIRLGEYQRAMTIMMEYGKRLSKLGRNVKEGAIDRLVSEYPDHSFVIDRHEACELFSLVREPTADEKRLSALLDLVFANNIEKRQGVLQYLSVNETGAAAGSKDVKTVPATTGSDSVGASASVKRTRKRASANPDKESPSYQTQND